MTTHQHDTVALLTAIYDMQTGEITYFKNVNKMTGNKKAPHRSEGLTE